LRSGWVTDQVGCISPNNFTMARFQKKISGPSWRSSANRLLTKLSVVGRLTRDTSRVQLVRPMTGRIRSNLKRTPDEPQTTQCAAPFTRSQSIRKGTPRQFLEDWLGNVINQ